MDPDEKNIVKDMVNDQRTLQAAKEDMEMLLTPGSKFLDGCKALAPAPKTAGTKCKPTSAHLRTIKTGAVAVPYLPKIKGCYLVRVANKSSWTVYYPGVPGSRSRAWGFAQPEHKVLAHCIQWDWPRHTKTTGLELPFLFLLEPMI